MKMIIVLRYSTNIGGISNFIRNLSRNFSIQGDNEYCGSSFWYRGQKEEYYKWFEDQMNY